MPKIRVIAGEWASLGQVFARVNGVCKSDAWFSANHTRSARKLKRGHPPPLRTIPILASAQAACERDSFATARARALTARALAALLP